MAWAEGRARGEARSGEQAAESGEQAAALSSAHGGGEGRARRAEWETKRKEGKSVPRLQRVLDTREFVLQAEGLA